MYTLIKISYGFMYTSYFMHEQKGVLYLKQQKKKINKRFSNKEISTWVSKQADKEALFSQPPTLPAADTPFKTF